MVGLNLPGLIISKSSPLHGNDDQQIISFVVREKDCLYFYVYNLKDTIFVVLHFKFQHASKIPKIPFASKRPADHIIGIFTVELLFNGIPFQILL